MAEQYNYIKPKDADCKEMRLPIPTDVVCDVVKTYSIYWNPELLEEVAKEILGREAVFYCFAVYSSIERNKKNLPRSQNRWLMLSKQSSKMSQTRGRRKSSRSNGSTKSP